MLVNVDKYMYLVFTESSIDKGTDAKKVRLIEGLNAYIAQTPIVHREEGSRIA